jgi:hypothetical protein
VKTFTVFVKFYRSFFVFLFIAVIIFGSVVEKADELIIIGGVFVNIIAKDKPNM